MTRMALVVIFLAGTAGLVRGQGSDLPVEDLVLPVATYPDGAIKTLLTASRTYAGAGGSIRAAGVTVKYFEKDGQTVTAVVEVENCTYDREHETVASADARIRLKRGALAVSGVGFELKAREENITIFKDVRVVFRREAAGKGKKD